MSSNVTLVGDAIENPANALTMTHAAAMFGASCRFRDTKGLASSEVFSKGLPAISSDEVRALHSRVIACDNLPGAKDVYGFDAGRNFALMVGNERRGLSHQFKSLATDTIHVPMHSRRINCLNVAAASAVALYYLSGPRVPPLAIRKEPGNRRPDILLHQPVNHFELGSTLRSAAGLGWERALIDDRHSVWFGCGRAIRSEGRAAARRARNQIHLIPCGTDPTPAYTRVTIVTHRQIGLPIHRVDLARGPTQLMIIPDESLGEFDIENWMRSERGVEVAHLHLPNGGFVYHYHLVATIALAEAARQVGRRRVQRPPPADGRVAYDYGLDRLIDASGEYVGFKYLLEF